MRRMRAGLSILTILTLSIAACTDGDESNTTAGGGTGVTTTTSGGTTSTTAAVGGSACQADAPISSGPDPLTFTVGDCTYQGQVEGVCSAGTITGDQFTFFYSDPALTEGLSSLQISVLDYAAGPSADWQGSFTVGKLSDAETRYFGGSGPATVTDSGDHATITGDGITDDGTSVTVDVLCSYVSR